MIDFLGYIRVRVNRDMPLATQPEVYLDQQERRAENGAVVNPPATVARLYLEPDVGGSRFFCFPVGAPNVEECLA